MYVNITAFVLWCLGSYFIFRAPVSPWWIVAYGLGSMLLLAGLVIRANRKP